MAERGPIISNRRRVYTVARGSGVSKDGRPERVERKLEAVVGLHGRILTWRCSHCNWTRLPDSPNHPNPAPHTVEMFRQHKCKDHPRPDPV
jgi:NAD-dependent SIR2 family protein deacetylase